MSCECMHVLGRVCASIGSARARLDRGALCASSVSVGVLRWQHIRVSVGACAHVGSMSGLVRQRVYMLCESAGIWSVHEVCGSAHVYVQCGRA